MVRCLLAAERVQCIPAGEVHARGRRKQAVLDGFGAGGRGRHTDALHVEGDCVLERKTSIVQADVDNRSRSHAQPRAVLRMAFGGRQEACFFREVNRVVRPPFGQRAAAQHRNS